MDEPFARTIDAAKKHVVSSTLERVDGKAELVRGDLAETVGRLTELPLALAALGLIDEYEFVVPPRVAGHGPTLFAGLSEPLDLTPAGRLEFRGGAVATQYVLRR